MTQHGKRQIFGDWRDQRDAMDLAYAEMKITPAQDELAKDWSIVEKTLKNYKPLHPDCSSCGQEVSVFCVYRCADCHSVFCENCIKPHFKSPGFPTNL